MTDDEERNDREEVFRKTVIELLHPEIAAVSHGNEQKSNVVHQPAPIPAGPQYHEEQEGKMYGASLPPPDYEQPVNTNMKRTSDLMESGSSSEADEEQAGARRKRHKQYRRSLKRTTVSLAESTAGVNTPQTNLTKNQKRKLKKKRQRQKLHQRSTQSKEFTYEQEAPGGNEEDKPSVDDVALREFLQGVWDVYRRDVTSCSRCGDLAETQEPEVFVQLVEKLVQGNITEEDVNTIGTLKALVVFNDRTRISEEITKLKESTSLLEGEKQLLMTLFNYWLTNISVLVKQSLGSELQPP